MRLALIAIEWTRPAGLFALALPLALLLLSLRRTRPAATPVGTFSIWARLAGAAAPAGARKRWHVPLERWCAIAALAAGALALGSPRAPRVKEPRPWRVVVDRSPSMYLALTDAEGGASAETRLEAALARARVFLDESDGGAVREWIDAEAPGSPSVLAREIPADWLAPPSSEQREPHWLLHDRERTIWITDREPREAREHAGLFASGGGRVPGAISSQGSTLYTWDGEHVAADPRPVAPGRIRIEGAAPALLSEFLSVWAEERGLALEGEGPVLLDVRVLGGEPARAIVCARDGWTLRATSSSAGTPVTFEGRALGTWLSGRADDGALPVVAWRTGTLVTSLVACEEPRGDPALFAVSWTELLDGALAPRPGIVSLAERADAGRAVDAPVAYTETSDVPGAAEGFPLTALLAALAAVLALCCVLVPLART
jgi:hypothetical protein